MEFEKRFCAFIDILGFKEKTKNFEDAVKYYKDYIKRYQIFTECDKNIWDAVYKTLNREDDQEELEEIIFSDSIILYSQDWLKLLNRIANVMAILMEAGFWFRGGIGYGKYYSDVADAHICMVSEGLVEAVELEEKRAIYPRIILSPRVVDKIHNEAKDLYQVAQLLIQCQDDYWCINPFFLCPDFAPLIQNINTEIKKFA